MKIANRMKEPTPKFFKKIRNIGLTLAAISASIVAAPIALPAILVKVAGYISVACVAATTVSQTAVKNEEE